MGKQFIIKYQEVKSKPNLPRTLGRLFLFVLLLAPTVPVTANGFVVQRIDSGCIDWSATAVKASGIIVPDEDDADRPTEPSSACVGAAMQAAEDRLLETVATIRIDAASQVADRMAESVVFRDELIQLTRNAAVARQKYSSDGTLEIELAMKLTGGFAQFVLPKEIRQVGTVTTMAGRRPFTVTTLVAAAEAANGPHTGLILDATGIDVQPAMVPLIVDESGEEVYGPAFVSREFAVSTGMSGFATTVSAARTNEKRVGNRPLVVKAIRTDTRGPTVLVIANADAAKLRSSAVYLDFLKACRVCIVMGPQPTPIVHPADSDTPSDGG